MTVEVEPLLNDHRSGYEDKKQRVAEFLNNLKTEPYDAVLVVTSGWVIKVAVAIIQDISNEQAWKIDAEQGSYLEFEI